MLHLQRGSPSTLPAPPAPPACVVCIQVHLSFVSSVGMDDLDVIMRMYLNRVWWLLQVLHLHSASVPGAQHGHCPVQIHWSVGSE